MGHLTVVSDRTARDFSKFGAVCAVAHDMFKTFIMFWHASPHQKFKPSEISDLAFVLTSSCLISSCFALFSMGSLPKNAGLLLEFDKASFLVTHFSYYTVINASPDSIIFNNDIYADDAIFYSSVVEAPDFWQ